jgi:hypothetical protein
MHLRLTNIPVDQDTAALKAKRETRRRRNSTATTIVSEGQTDTDYVSDSTRGPAGDGFDGVRVATSRSTILYCKFTI